MIVGASGESTGCLVVVQSPAQDPEGEGTFHLVTVRDGSAVESVLLCQDDVLKTGYTTTTYRGHFGLAWSEPYKGIRFASVQEGMPRIETILDDDFDDGSFGDFWFVESEKGQAKLFVSRYRHVAPDGKAVIDNKQYIWLYAYALHNDGPPKALGRGVCVESAELECSKLACAASGDDVVIWQTADEQVGLLDTVRFAKWDERGRLDWRGRYTGNDPLGLLVDLTNGSRCLVKEWKSPVDASGILCSLGIDTTSITHVGDYVGSIRQVRFAWIAKRKTWMIAFKSPESIRLIFLDDDLSPVRTANVEAKGVTDYAIVQRDSAISVVLLHLGYVSCREVGFDSAKPARARRDKQQRCQDEVHLGSRPVGHAPRSWRSRLGLASKKVKKKARRSRN
jgi:hypothetical protein